MASPPGEPVYIVGRRCARRIRQMAARRHRAVDRRRTATRDTARRRSTATRHISCWRRCCGCRRSSPPGDWTANLQVRNRVAARRTKSDRCRATAAAVVGAAASDAEGSSSTTVLRGTSASGRSTVAAPWCGSDTYSRRRRRCQSTATCRQHAPPPYHPSLHTNCVVRTTQSWTLSVINRQRSSVDVESTLPRPPSPPGVINNKPTNVVCLHIAPGNSERAVT